MCRPYELCIRVACVEACVPRVSPLPGIFRRARVRKLAARRRIKIQEAETESRPPRSLARTLPTMTLAPLTLQAVLPPASPAPPSPATPHPPLPALLPDYKRTGAYFSFLDLASRTASARSKAAEKGVPGSVSKSSVSFSRSAASILKAASSS